jgi:hypothetical protein
MTKKELMRLIEETAETLKSSQGGRFELEQIAKRIMDHHSDDLMSSWEDASYRNILANAKRWMRSKSEELVEPKQLDWIKKYLPGDVRAMYAVPKGKGKFEYVEPLAMVIPDRIGHQEILVKNAEASLLRSDEFADQTRVLKPFMPDDTTTVGEALEKMNEEEQGLMR